MYVFHPSPRLAHIPPRSPSGWSSVRPTSSHLPSRSSSIVSHIPYRNLRRKEFIQAYPPGHWPPRSPRCSSPPYGSTQLRPHGCRTCPPGDQFIHGLGRRLGPPVTPSSLSPISFLIFFPGATQPQSRTLAVSRPFCSPFLAHAHERSSFRAAWHRNDRSLRWVSP